MQMEKNRELLAKVGVDLLSEIAGILKCKTCRYV